jgi:hypothetical protein
MLAKQGSLNSLIARMYKARLLNTLHIILGVVLFATRELLMPGTRWQVGDGKSIFVWIDSWIPRDPSLEIIITVRQ